MVRTIAAGSRSCLTHHSSSTVLFRFHSSGERYGAFHPSANRAAVRRVRFSPAPPIQRGERFGHHTWMPVSDAEHQAPDADTRGLDRQCGHRRYRFEAIAIASLRWRFLKVIRDREPIEATLVGEPPELSHLGEWPPEMPEMDPEPNTRSPSTDHPKASAWPAPDCWYRGPAPQA